MPRVSSTGRDAGYCAQPLRPDAPVTTGRDTVKLVPFVTVCTVAPGGTVGRCTGIPVTRPSVEVTLMEFDEFEVVAFANSTAPVTNLNVWPEAVAVAGWLRKKVFLSVGSIADPKPVTTVLAGMFGPITPMPGSNDAAFDTDAILESSVVAPPPSERHTLGMSFGMAR